jgi:hypothetical protein
MRGCMNAWIENESRRIKKQESRKRIDGLKKG